MAMSALDMTTGRLGDMSTSTLTRTRFPSAVLVALGLAVGFGVAQGTGVRALGGAVFAVCGVGAAWLWVPRRGRGGGLGPRALYLPGLLPAPLLALPVGPPPRASGRSISRPSSSPTCWLSRSACPPGWR